MGGNIGRDAVKGIQSIAKKGVSKIPIVGSIVDPIMNLLKRSDEQKLREWAFQDQIAKRYLTPSQYKQYKAQDKRKLGSGIPFPFPFVDFKKGWDVISNPNLFKGPEVSAEEGRKIVANYKRQYADYKKKGGTRSYGSWIKWKGYGKGLDIHNAILKVAPKKGFVMPGHRYTGPGNPLEQQLKYDPNTGQILEIYQQPTGKTDAVSMQHDVDYSVCGNKPKKDQVKCKNDADRKMVKALDAIPWKERQWGHAIARNAIAAKSKLGMGVKKPKNVKSRRVKKTGKKN